LFNAPTYQSPLYLSIYIPPISKSMCTTLFHPTSSSTPLPLSELNFNLELTRWAILVLLLCRSMRALSPHASCAQPQKKSPGSNPIDSSPFIMGAQFPRKRRYRRDRPVFFTTNNSTLLPAAGTFVRKQEFQAMRATSIITLLLSFSKQLQVKPGPSSSAQTALASLPSRSTCRKS